MKYYVIAGEASGDLHGANLMKALKQEDAQAEFRGFGGDLMQQEGAVLDKHCSELAFMGFVEVLANLRTIFSNIKQAKQSVLAYKPDALILIDFPGFNLKIAEFAKKEGIPVFFYISPKVWAWNQKRVLKIKKVVDHLFCILPFEVDFYKTWGMEVDYVGNPLMDAISAHKVDKNFRNTHNISEKPILALLPGSRKMELKHILPDMLAASDLFPDYECVLAGAPMLNQADYAPYLGNRKIKIISNATYDLVLNAQAALVTSGTATLETALLKCPQVVLYKGSKLSVAIARLLVKIKFISLVNLILDKEVVKELIQEDCNPAEIATQLGPLLTETPQRVQMLADYETLAERVGPEGASGRTAKLVQKYLRKSN
ncbi:MAG: lipid-A-disaccharide synthase [Sphingobacteriaceae bacterium]